MRAVRYCFLFFALCLAVTPSYAQWAVFDASNLAEAVKEFKQLQKVYTTANQTRDQIIQSYNLAHYMSQMPQNLAQRYKAQFAMWTNSQRTQHLREHFGMGQRPEHRPLTTVDDRISGRRSSGQFLSAVWFRTARRHYSGDDSEPIRDLRPRTGHDDRCADHTRPGPLAFRVPQSTDLQSRSRLVLERSNPAIGDGGSCQGQCRELGSAPFAAGHQSIAFSAGIQQQMVAQKQAIDAQNRTINERHLLSAELRGHNAEDQ